MKNLHMKILYGIGLLCRPFWIITLKSHGRKGILEKPKLKVVSFEITANDTNGSINFSRRVKIVCMRKKTKKVDVLKIGWEVSFNFKKMFLLIAVFSLILGRP